VTDRSSPLDVLRAYLEAWTNHDIATAAGYLAEDMTFDGPIMHATSAHAFVNGPGGLAGFARNVVPGSLRMVAAFGDGTQALVMYEITTGALGTVLSAEHFTVADGKIRTERLVFDAGELRAARAAAGGAQA
jgi:hypothetical protein